jgi:[protein-PII] uridylyltransferase
LVLAELGPGPSRRPAPPVDVEVPASVDDDAVLVEVEPADDGSTVRFVAGDRVGLLADEAAVFALQRTSVRAAHAWSQGEYGVSVWEVAEEHLDPAVLRQRFEAIAAGRVDPGERLRPPTSDALAPAVVVRPEASDQATVLEVRATDRPGTVHLVCAALARLGLAVRSAHVDTLGPQAVDVFYVQEEAAGALSDERAAEAAHAVRSALTGTAG